MSDDLYQRQGWQMKSLLRSWEDASPEARAAFLIEIVMDPRELYPDEKYCRSRVAAVVDAVEPRALNQREIYVGLQRRWERADRRTRRIFSDFLVWSRARR